MQQFKKNSGNQDIKFARLELLTYFKITFDSINKKIIKKNQMFFVNNNYN